MFLFINEKKALRVKQRLEPSLLVLSGVIMVGVGKAHKSNYYLLVVTIEKSKDSQKLRDDIHCVTGMYPVRIETSGPIVAY